MHENYTIAHKHVILNVCKMSWYPILNHFMVFQFYFVLQKLESVIRWWLHFLALIELDKLSSPLFLQHIVSTIKHKICFSIYLPDVLRLIIFYISLIDMCRISMDRYLPYLCFFLVFLMSSSHMRSPVFILKCMIITQCLWFIYIWWLIHTFPEL